MFGVFLASTFAARSQSLTFNTLAGYAGHGSSDGSGSNARFNEPDGLAADSAGNVYVADTANHTIRKITASGAVSTLAGVTGSSGANDGPSSLARFNQPQAVAVDNSGNVYVADTANHTIRKITSGGTVTTLAGLAAASGTNDGSGSNARFYQPEGIAADSTGNLYVADTWNNTIRKITSAGAVTTLAGSATNSGSADGTGGNALFYQPQGIAVDSTGKIYVGDTGNHTIRKITGLGAVTTLAGSAGIYGHTNANGTSAQFYAPQGVAVDAGGNVYVADYFNQEIRKISPAGAVSTLAGSPSAYGSADGTGASARFYGPQGVAVSGATLYAADTGNGTIRQITGAGLVSTFAGSASSASADGTSSAARFYTPSGVAVDGSGNVYLSDAANSTIRKSTPSGLVNTLAGLAGSFGATDGLGSGARFGGPQGISVGGSGTIFVADTSNHTIRKVTAAGVVSTLAGLAGTSGALDGSGNNALFFGPQAVAADSSGTVYVADTWNHTIRKITSAGLVSTIAGSPGDFGSADGTNANARFNSPAGIALDGSGNLYVSDYLNHTIRKLIPSGTSWASSTLAGTAGVWGSADGTNGNARFFGPQGISLDSLGNLYVSDSGNHALRKLTPLGTNWVVSTVAGVAGLSGSAGGSGSGARFSYPAGFTISSNGGFYVADAGNNSLRLGALITNGAPAIVAQPQSQTTDPGGSVLFNVGALGANPLAYQWRLNGGNLAGATASSYARGNAQNTDAGNYSVLVSNPNGNVTSADALLTLSGPPFIVTQPQSQNTTPGQSVSFSVVASGSQPLGYQWRFNDNNIPGATDVSFSLASAQGPNNGSYSVVVSNALGLVLSAEAVLGVVTASAWGENSWGQSSVPAFAVNLVAIAAGAWHNLGLRVDGSVVAWGDNIRGQCNVPGEVTDVLAIAAGGDHSLAIRRDGSAVAWGSDDAGESDVPGRLGRVIAISAGAQHSLALRQDGTVVAWGDNTFGQTTVPAALSNVVAIAAGGYHSLALRADGTAVGWGANSVPEGGFTGQATVPWGLSNIVTVVAGDYHSLALLRDGTVAAWGDNSQDQCSVPAGLTNVVALAGGGAHTLALRQDGSVAAWGANWNGQCSLPANLADVIALGAGEDHSLALGAAGFPVPLLLNPWKQGNRFNALVQSFNRKNYALEFKNSAASVNWTALSTNAGNGALKVLTDPAAPLSQRLYRLRLW